MKSIKLIIFIALTLLSSKGIDTYLSFFSRFNPQELVSFSFEWLILIWFSVSIYAWTAYFIMGYYWVINKKLNKHYVLSGHYSAILTVASLGPAMLGIVTLLPSVFLALYLVGFHTGNKYIYTKSLTNSSS